MQVSRSMVEVLELRPGTNPASGCARHMSFHSLLCITRLPYAGVLALSLDDLPAKCALAVLTLDSLACWALHEHLRVAQGLDCRSLQCGPPPDPSSPVTSHLQTAQQDAASDGSPAADGVRRGGEANSVPARLRFFAVSRPS